MNISTMKQDWLGNIRGDILAGIVVALALIPEAIAFSIIAGVSPMVGLYASFCIAVVISFFGGRPAMISAATGAMALVMGDLVADYGLQYLLAATILTGILQVSYGFFKVARLMKFIPRSVMIGFVNALAILIFMSQLPHFAGESWHMYAMVAGSLAIIYLFPFVTKIIPAPLVAIIAITVVAMLTGSGVRTVGDMGELSQTLPMFLLPDIPLTFETLQIIFPTALALSVIGLLESFLTAQIVDDMTDSDSNKNREAKGQGIANVVAGFFGGMAGCAMIGQSVINVKSGARGRLSTFVAGVFLMLLIVVFNDILVQIPMAALVGVMIMVSIGTFDWSSVTNLHLMPRTDAIVMVVTVTAVVLTHDLSIGVLIGVLLSAIFFASKISKVEVIGIQAQGSRKKVYKVKGQLFFASVTDFVSSFDFKEDIDEMELDLTGTHLWDDSAVGAIDKVVLKYKENQTEVTVVGLNKESSSLVERRAVYDKPSKKIASH
ncbi:SulP family inorganic anion transporter [Radiobacillus deserti]|uniref:SulP family inorganic anion transporter n=1 Tax=Radiobacillus deserti TaxID=2594883 RepID=A0A516KI01_9BACI|nr:SulP family inorganic anion transporter [Radiobacillus deserti]QDP41025.1 SulP family inorganic anion transporter [Radiobacillus deserti]